MYVKTESETKDLNAKCVDLVENNKYIYWNVKIMLILSTTFEPFQISIFVLFFLVFGTQHDVVISLWLSLIWIWILRLEKTLDILCINLILESEWHRPLHVINKKVDLFVNRNVNIDVECTAAVICELCELRDTHERDELKFFIDILCTK